MKDIFLGTIIAMLPISTMASDGSRAPSPYVSSQPGLEISARRGQAEETFEIAAIVSDTSTGKVIASPKMTVRAGTWAQATIGSKGESGSGVALSASVDPSGRLLAYFVEASQADGDKKTYSGTSFVAP